MKKKIVILITSLYIAVSSFVTTISHNPNQQVSTVSKPPAQSESLDFSTSLGMWIRDGSIRLRLLLNGKTLLDYTISVGKADSNQ
jgi:hypothetical protein